MEKPRRWFWIITCIYCGRRLVQPTVKYNNKDYHLDCYVKKDGFKIFAKSILDSLIRRLEFMGEICDNALDNNNPNLAERQKKYEKIRAKYADYATETLNEAQIVWGFPWDQIWSDFIITRYCFLILFTQLGHKTKGHFNLVYVKLKLILSYLIQ